MSARTTVTGSAVPIPFEYLGASDVIQDLKAYFVAVYSYPDHFAEHPELTFQEHLLNVMADITLIAYEPHQPEKIAV